MAANCCIGPDRSGTLRLPLTDRDAKSGRDKRQLVEQLPICTRITKQGAYETHCWPPCCDSQAQAGRKPRQVQTTALQGHLQPAAPNTHLTFDRLRSLPKLHLQELEWRDHGPDVADVSALQLLGGQGCAGQSCQGAEPRQRASRQRRVGDLPWHHSRGNSFLGWRGTQTSHYNPARGPRDTAQDKLTLQSHHLQGHESRNVEVLPEEGQRQRISRIFMTETKIYESCQEE